MPQTHLDNSVRAFFYQIILLSSKVSTSSDVSDVIEEFYASHLTSKIAVVEIDSILRSVGIYKIGKEGRECYILKKVKNRIADEDSSQILNAGMNLISRILYRDQLQQKIDRENNRETAMELKSEMELLNQEISNRNSRQNLLSIQLRAGIISDIIAVKENPSTSTLDLIDTQ